MTSMAAWLAGALLAAAATSPLGAQSPPSPRGEQPGQPLPRRSAAVPRTLSAQDRELVDKAGAGGLYGMALARLAAKRSDSASVRELARQMTVESYNTSSELIYLGQSRHFTMTPALDGKQSERLRQLSDLRGHEFDVAWLTTAIHEHEDALKAFEDEARHGHDPELERFAGRVVPILRSHVGAAKAAKDKLGG